MAAPDGQRDAVISVRGLVNRFDDNVIHQGLDLDVYRGEVIGVVGGSGTGKSVLLRTIIGLNHPITGSIRLLGTDMINGGPEEAARGAAALRRAVGMVRCFPR